MSFELQLRGWRLTTAEILYHMPDHPSLLQSFVWQELDLTPDFPMLQRFLAFWDKQLEGRVHSVQVCSASVIKPADLRVAEEFGMLN